MLFVFLSGKWKHPISPSGIFEAPVPIIVPIVTPPHSMFNAFRSVNGKNFATQSIMAKFLSYLDKRVVHNSLMSATGISSTDCSARSYLGQFVSKNFLSYSEPNNVFTKTQ